MRKFIKKGDCITVAEISANHAQSFDRAVEMIKIAKMCGADSVKFQTYTPDTLTLDTGSKYFRIKHSKWRGQTLYRLYQKAYMPWEWFKKLKMIADQEGIMFFSTAFDKTSVDLLEELDVPVHKIASFELVDLPLIEYAAQTGKPLILSTGMATVTEIKEAVKVARKAGAKEIILLKCVSSYPAKPEQMNLVTIPHMKEKFNCKVGLSDHTLGSAVAVTAVSLGICMVEKHLTLSRRIKTPDSFFSIEPNEFKELVGNIKTAKKSLGRIHYGVTEEEKHNRIFRRSLFAVEDIQKGQEFTLENTRSIRPANGLKPKYLISVIGRCAKLDIKRGTPLAWNMVANH